MNMRRSLFYLTRLVPVIIVVFFSATSLESANVSGAWSRDTLLEQMTLNRLSIGANYEQILRPITIKDTDQHLKLDARRISGFLGVDITRWFTLFGTAGGIEAKEKEESSYESPEFAWSAGAYLNLWQYNLKDPTFLEGRLTFRLLGEFSQNRSSDKKEWKWDEIYAAFLVGYEIFTISPATKQKYPYSLLLFGGPSLSYLDGHYEKDGIKKDFEEQESIGVLGGAELFISHNLSIGGHIQYYDDITAGASIRYHF